jgi:hypothetical protein
MTHPKIAVWTSFALASTLVGCSNSDGDTSLIQVAAAVQDLDADPDGVTTVLTLSSPVTGLASANFESDGGQTPQSIVVVGADVAVSWDERVTPAHRVRVVNVQGVSAAYVDVETSDDSAPTFSVVDALQVAGLGDDVVTLQFSGPRVIEAQAEDAANWSLEVGGETLSLAGSTFDYDPLTGELTLVTGPSANLHSAFTLTALALHSVADVEVDDTPVIGAANGDASAPTLVSAEQNLSEDEFGRVIDFTFDEAMDPLFSASTARFTAGSPDLALSVEQPSAEVLRVTFNNPMVPGVDDVTLTALVDAHGNALANQATPIAAGSTVPNDFDGAPEFVTVENVGGDYLLASFDQALDPDDALDPTHWELSYDDGGGAVVLDLSSATLDYDLLTKTLTLQLADDFLNGADFTLAGVFGDEPLDVDGEPFTASFAGTVDGDATAPAPLTAVQRRNLDTWGRTIDVRFGEDLDETSAEDVNNWSVTGLNVQTATLVALRVVRLVTDDTAVPGDATISIDGVMDLAGNVMAAVPAQSFTSSDGRAPAGVSSLAEAIEGLDNDTLYVSFDDRLIESEIEDGANWVFESPVGTLRDLSSAAIVYDINARTATVTLGVGTGIDLQTDTDYSLAWVGVRDLGGNTISSATLTGEIDAEVVLPSVISAFVDALAPNSLYVRFSEPCQQLDDIAGLTEFQVFDNTGLLKGLALNAIPDADGLRVELIFGFALSAGSDTLALRGVLDAAGNPLFSATDIPLESEYGLAPTLDTMQSSFTTLPGERNDVIELVFDRVLSPWGLLDASRFEIELVGQPVDLSAATISFDGQSTVTISLDGAGAPDLVSGASYDLTFHDVYSAQGLYADPNVVHSIVAGGDASAPSLPAGWARLDASSATDTLLVVFSEALESVSAETVGNYLLNGATAPDSVELIDWRTVRCVFSGGVVVGDTLDFSGLADLAGNIGVGTRAVSAADVSGPVVVSAQAVSVPGPGGDRIEVEFNRPLDLGAALSASNWSLTMGSHSYDLTDARLRWSSGSFSVVIELPQGQELEFGATVSVGASGLSDLAGLALNPAASLNVAVQGDSTAPDFAGAFVNYRVSGSGTVVDIVFDEAVEPNFALDSFNWSASNGALVIGVEQRSPDYFRLELSLGLSPGDTLELNGLPDLAGNSSGPIVVTPLH